MDWKDGVKAIAPTIGGLLTAFGGPAGALAGAGLTAVANALGVPDNATAVEAALSAGITPEQRAQLVAADLDYKKALLDVGIKEKEIAASTEKAYLTDVADARAHNANTVGILRLGYIINVASYATIAAVLYGSFKLVSGETMKAIDPTTAAMVGSIVGACVQWLMSSTAQANGFFFGSSPGSRQAATDMGKAVAGGAPVGQIRSK